MRLLFGVTIAYIALGVSALNPLGGSENKVLGLVGTSATAQPRIKNVQQADNHHQSSDVQYNTFNENNTDKPGGLIGAVMKRRLIRRKQQKNTGPPDGSVLATVTKAKVLNLDMGQKTTSDPAKNKGTSSGGPNELLGKKAVDLATPGPNDPKKKGGPDPIVNVAPGDHAITKITAPQLSEGFVTTGDQQPPQQA
ncbi:hypothetical protein BJV82DRAFT_716519 [Fennellomyces sp. T-0311]|nr:hypothetical protein BJV82DRAFT_716519 [Fennellomyces sp. T-0311]